MPTSIKLITAPTVEPVSLADAKLFLRVDDDDDDALITSLITAARQSAESYTRRALTTQTLDMQLDTLGRVTELWRPPLLTITGLYWTNDAGAETTVTATNYTADTLSNPGRLILDSDYSYPSDVRDYAGWRVRYTAGYGAAATNVPQSIIEAVKRTIAYYYEHRDDAVVGTITAKMPVTAQVMLDAYRMVYL